MHTLHISGFLILLLVGVASFGLISSDHTNDIALENNADQTLACSGFQPPFLYKLDADRQPDEASFYYSVAPRFMQHVTPEQLNTLQSAEDLLGHDGQSTTYESLEVVVVDDRYRTLVQLPSDSGQFSSAQLALLGSLQTSTNFIVRSRHHELTASTGKGYARTITPHFTVVPEKRANYLPGTKALLDYLKNESADAVDALNLGNVQSGKINFTVSRFGNIIDVELLSSSGHPTVDERMIHLIQSIPGTWLPAENAEGEHIAERLVFSFGNQGC